MNGTISEADWKLFAELKAVALDRFSRDALARAATICATPLDDWPSGNALPLATVMSGAGTFGYATFRELSRLVTETDRQIAEAFDGHSRSRAWLQLMQIVRLDLLTSDELAGFSDDMQDVIRRARTSVPEAEDPACH